MFFLKQFIIFLKVFLTPVKRLNSACVNFFACQYFIMESILLG
ncbi:hypothetical protein CWATWH0401_1738 [Crocosphaera watsonii WH 0401]|uniref:Uncharacterized protein n=1 Tax=Crocosphaera watsonii WH 0401 TaxID=555881 RepID=T2J6N3_CROWT|nr:hypothetical protein CWATWH0401_1738 [Crocosphaera watsonii WH 0401]